MITLEQENFPTKKMAVVARIMFWSDPENENLAEDVQVSHPHPQHFAFVPEDAPEEVKVD